jgi:glycosyltransferase involved in cell wall biosynthesis
MIKNQIKGTVLQIIPHATYSGVEKSAKAIATNLVDVGYKVVVLSESKDLESYFKSLNIKHFYLNIHSSNPFIILRNAIKIINIIKSENIDIVHARSRGPAWSCAIATKITNKFFITTFHSIYNNSSFLIRYYNSIMARGEKVVAISYFVKNHIMMNYNVNKKRIILIPRGIDTDYFNQENIDIEARAKFKGKYNINDNIVIIVPADFSKWKGHKVIIAALSMIKHLHFSCLLVGDLLKHPEYVQEINNKIIALKLQSKVKIFGFEQDKRSLYSIGDIIISASTSPEAFDKTIIETQSMERIILSTDLGSSSEMISDEKTGFLVKNSDAKELSEKLEFIINNIDSPELKVIREEARKSVIKNFGLPEMIKKTSKLYDEILNKI